VDIGQGDVRFGSFELDLRTGELRKGGFRVRLQEQPLRILALLVDRAGELVTREDLRQTLWSHDTYVDFDRGLNNAVRRLREALGDSADAPRFVETLARRGYRFIAPVERLPMVPAEAPRPPAPAVAAPALPAAAPVPVRPPLPARLRTGLLATAAGLALLAALYGAWPRASSTAAGRGRAMLLVLPFVNLSGDPEQEYFSDGLTEEMIARLAVLQPTELGVIARTSAMHYKGTQKRTDQIGRELGVAYILESSVRRAGNRVRVTTQLIAADTQEHLWSETYERELGDVLRLQVEVAEAIAGQVQVRLTGPMRARLQAAPVDPEAHSLYLKGRFFAAQRTADGLARALSLYREALGREPHYAAAQAGIADVHLIRAWYGITSEPEALAEARAAAEAAVGLDPGSADAYVALACTRLYHDWDWPGAEQAFRQAIALNPAHAVARHRFGYYYLRARGRLAEAMAEVKQALELDPLSLGINVALADLYVDAGRTDEALAQCRRTLELNPQFHVARLVEGEAYEKAGRRAEALASYEKAAAARYGTLTPFVESARLLALSGQPEAARRRVAQGRAEGRSYVPIQRLARLHLALGERDEALSLLLRADAEKIVGLEHLKHDPAFAPLKGDARFVALLQRIGPPD
jgi:TolB-like protein/DNA-binding winged helix-turn-helix (wHTH) protein/tetratricopeptide (TPR) repeat protein